MRDHKVVMCAVGRNHSLLLNQVGQVFSAGFNEFGQLGLQQDYSVNSQLLPKDFDQQKQIQFCDNFIRVNSHRSFKLIRSLETIEFIACGEHHSLAITSLAARRKDDRLQLYSWGWGAYGQLGHTQIKNHFNVREPMPIQKFSQNKVKIAMVSATLKHTLVLDVNNKLWYFGSKEAVGVTSSYQICQYEPMLLLPSESQDKKSIKDVKFIFVSAGLNRNIAVTQDNELFAFGGVQKNKNLAKQQNNVSDLNSNTFHISTFEKIFDGANKPLKSQFVSCGTDHYASIADESFSVYTWGKNSNFKLGFPKEEKNSDYFNLPQEIPEIKQMINKSIQNILDNRNEQNQKVRLKIEYPQASKKQDQDIQPAHSETQRKIKFQIQKQLQDCSGIQNAAEIEKMQSTDNLLQQKMKSACQEFNQQLSKRDLQQKDQVIRTQDALITRILNFPVKIDKLKYITHNQMPEKVVKNRQIYEFIFTLLQTHPCYIINLITQTECYNTTEKVRSLVNIVFGKNQIHDNKRIIRTLMVIADQVLAFELKKLKLADLDSHLKLKLPLFKEIFRIIFQSQSQNQFFMSQQVANDVIESFLSQSNYFQQTIMLNEKGEQEKIEFEQYKAMQSALDRLVKKFNEMIKINDSEAQSNRRNSKLSHEVVSLILNGYSQIKKEIESLISSIISQNSQENFLNQGQKQIQLLLLDFIIEFGLNPLLQYKVADVRLLSKTIPQDKLNFFYKDEAAVSAQEAKNQSLKPIFYDFVEKMIAYFDNSQNTQVQTTKDPNLRSLIQSGKVKSDDKKKQTYKDLIFEGVKKSFIAPIDFTQVLIEQMFLSSSDLDDESLTITIGNLLEIQSSLQANIEKIQIESFVNKDDPLFLAVEMTLFESQQIKEYVNEKLKINLRIEQRLLLKNEKFVKCHDCYAPVTENLIGLTRFQSAFEGIDWKCNNCKTQNSKESGYLCKKCKFFIVKDDLPQDLIYERYCQNVLKSEVNDFSDVLLILPEVEEQADFNDKLEEHIIHLKKNNKTFEIIKLESFQQNLKILAKNEISSQKTVTVQKQLTGDEYELIEATAARRVLQKLADEITQLYNYRNEHVLKVRSQESFFLKIEQIKVETDQLFIFNNQVLNKILLNAYSGLASEFLEHKLLSDDLLPPDVKQLMDEKSNSQNFNVHSLQNEIEGANQNNKAILAGHFQTKDKIYLAKLKEIEKQKKKKIKQQQQPEWRPFINFNKYFSVCKRKKQDLQSLEQIMDSVNNAEKSKSNEETKQQATALLFRERNVVGEYPYKILLKKSVIVDDQNDNYQQQSRNRYSYLKFQYDFKDGHTEGIKVSKIHRPLFKLSLDCWSDQSEQIEEEFTIKTAMLTEIRRNFALKAVIKFQKTKFQIYNLVQELNNLIAGCDIFQEPNKIYFGDDKQLRLVYEKDKQKKKAKQNASHTEQSEWNQTSITEIALNEEKQHSQKKKRTKK